VTGLLVLWDVDHTLIDAGGTSSELYRTVFAELFGRELASVVPMAGRTDRAIIVDTLTGAGIRDPRSRVDEFVAALAAHAPDFAAQVRARGRVLPGAAEALTALTALADEPSLPGGGPVRQSVLTGNIRPLADAKLRTLGLISLLDMNIGAYGDEHESRAELVHIARRHAAQAHGPSGSSGRPADRSAGGRARGGTGAEGETGAETGARDKSGARDRTGSGTEGATGAESGSGAGGTVKTESRDGAGDVRADPRDRPDRPDAVPFTGTATVLIGDTPLDVLAALATGARAIGVATGAYPADQLAAAGAHLVLADLADTGQVLEAILGRSGRLR